MINKHICSIHIMFSSSVVVSAEVGNGMETNRMGTPRDDRKFQTF
jgi:hypothetical protein